MWHNPTGFCTVIFSDALMSVNLGSNRPKSDFCVKEKNISKSNGDFG